MRQLPILFGQLDYLQQLGKGNFTIAERGDYLCCFAMLARYYGKQTDPVELNQLFIEKLLYINNDEMVDDNLQKAYGDISFLQNYHFEGVPADLTTLKTLLSDPGTSVILEIDTGNSTTRNAVCVGVNGTVTIANPATKQVEDFSMLYGDPQKNIIKYIVYQGTPVQTDTEINDQLKVDRDKYNQLYQDQVKLNDELQAQLKDAQGKTETLHKSYNDLSDKVAILTNEVKQVTDANGNLADLYSKKCKEDSAAVDDGREAIKQVEDLVDYLHSIAAAFSITALDKSEKAITEEILKQADEVSKLVNRADLQVLLDNYKAVISFLEGQGLNEYLKVHEATPIDKAKLLIDTISGPRIILFLEELVKELQSLYQWQKAITNKPAKTGKSHSLSPVPKGFSAFKPIGFFSAITTRIGDFIFSKP